MQAFNDFLVFGAMAIALVLVRRAVVALWLEPAVNEVVFPVILVAAVLLAWGSLVRRPKPV